MSCATLMDENSLALTGNTVLLYRNLFYLENARVFGVSQKATALGTGVILCASVGILNRL